MGVFKLMVFTVGMAGKMNSKFKLVMKDFLNKIESIKEHDINNKIRLYVVIRR